MNPEAGALGNYKYQTLGGSAALLCTRTLPLGCSLRSWQFKRLRGRAQPSTWLRGRMACTLLLRTFTGGRCRGWMVPGMKLQGTGEIHHQHHCLAQTAPSLLCAVGLILLLQPLLLAETGPSTFVPLRGQQDAPAPQAGHLGSLQYLHSLGKPQEAHHPGPGTGSGGQRCTHTTPRTWGSALAGREGARERRLTLSIRLPVCFQSWGRSFVFGGVGAACAEEDQLGPAVHLAAGRIFLLHAGLRKSRREREASCMPGGVMGRQAGWGDR